ncbi:Error-prone repair protein ImuA [Dyadobacter sp. CY107]|uniref:ImuA family protein n=1 Tax=Dyadobacter fanqingshengii TaxID=2906443 RepID=UPI001F3C6D13|nr:Error-prone repair protein ImuA [Dyadobacter fanqingshengii]MCF2505706.1 Error-prone repair protein ImuA [Dyadobacter fanqingshengii]
MITIYSTSIMNHPALKSDVAKQLQKEILSLQGFKTASDGPQNSFYFGELEAAFPNQVFPTGAVHEFLSSAREDAAATTGFMMGLLGKLLQNGGACLWISMNRTLFPPAMKFFGIEPDKVIFIDLSREQDVLWAVEESLKCEALTAVVGELNEITLTQSRRLQLAVEQSRVTGFLHRCNPRSMNTLACVSRWKVTPIPSHLEDDMPGVGFPRWHVQLLKVRNGEPGEWEMEWSEGRFNYLEKEVKVQKDNKLLRGPEVVRRAV